MVADDLPQLVCWAASTNCAQPAPTEENSLPSNMVNVLVAACAVPVSAPMHTSLALWLASTRMEK
jgi:hypothetical protein